MLLRDLQIAKKDAYMSISIDKNVTERTARDNYDTQSSTPSS